MQHLDPSHVDRTSPRIALTSALLTLLFTLLSAGTGHAQTESEDAARRHFQAGRAHFDRAEYEDAVRAYEESYRLSAHSELLINMANAYEAAGRPQEAIATLERWQTVSPAEDPMRTSVDARISRLRLTMQRTRPQTQASVAVSGTTELAATTEAPAAPAVVPGPVRIYGGPRLSFGGEVEYDPKVGSSNDDDLLTTFGGQLGVEYGLHAYFAAGLELRLAGLSSDLRDDNDIGRDLFVDIDLKPRARYLLSSFPLELYASLPLGLTIIRSSSDIAESYEQQGYTNVEVSAGPGFNLGIMAGLTYFANEHFGANLEAGYLLYWFSGEDKADQGKLEADYALGQFSLLANLVYAL